MRRGEVMKRDERGFTLVELIVVLIISSVISTYLTTTFLNTLYFNKRVLIQADQAELDLIIESIIQDILHSADIKVNEDGIEILTQENGWVAYQIYTSSNGPALGYKKEKSISLSGDVEYTRIDSIIADVIEFSWEERGNILYLTLCKQVSLEEQIYRYRTVHEGGRFWALN